VTDVAVVGGGVIGLSVALALQECGHTAVVLERSGVASGQSGVQPGGVRQQWGTPIACRLAREAVAWWRDAEERLASPVPLGFQACGYLFVAHGGQTLERLAANVAVQNAEGVPSRIVTPGEAAELVPGLEPGELAGAAWCAEDGYFDRPQAAIEAIARHVDVRIGEVTALARAGTGWVASGPFGEVTADAVVVATGVDANALLGPLGCPLPIEPEERHLFLSAPVRERLLEPLVVAPELRFAAKQLGDGRVLASDLGAVGDPEEGAARWRAAVREGIRRLVPILEYVDLGILASGRYDVTPDRQPVLGPVPGHDGLHVAAGFSGHGFMIAPAVGRIVAAGVLGEADPILEVLDAARFAAGRPVPEPQVV
jgi:sarcosine oxidase, subunit beta